MKTGTIAKLLLARGACLHDTSPCKLIVGDAPLTTVVSLLYALSSVYDALSIACNGVAWNNQVPQRSMPIVAKRVRMKLGKTT